MTDADSVKRVLDRLESDVVDDPEELLFWLATDGVEVLREWFQMKKLDASQEGEAMIDWQAIRQRRADGRLMADEIDALIDLAKSSGEYWVRPPGGMLKICLICGDVYPFHSPDCPIAVLEHASEEETNGN